MEENLHPGQFAAIVYACLRGPDAGYHRLRCQESRLQFGYRGPCGVSGRYDPKKAAGETKKDVVHMVQGSREETCDSVENKVGDSRGEGKRRLNEDGD
ncbi:hypothetical protein [Nitrosococcus oceani]|uniref:hypothetical protein n=1 Tax=Nitrosococcus oceani TaxID=1229 RepID=UPI000A904C85|nr:hypothetical protein [Nitrosococcus oceani]